MPFVLIIIAILCLVLGWGVGDFFYLGFYLIAGFVLIRLVGGLVGMDGGFWPKLVSLVIAMVIFLSLQSCLLGK